MPISRTDQRFSDLIGRFKPKSKPKDKVPQSTSAHTSSANKPTTVLPVGKKPKPTLAHLAKEMNFDLIILRSSFFIDFLSHALVSLIPVGSGSGLFVAFTTLSCLGTGVLPAVNSLALCVLQTRSEAVIAAGGTPDADNAGRLFGALASVQSVGQMILGVSCVLVMPSTRT